MMEEYSNTDRTNDMYNVLTANTFLKFLVDLLTKHFIGFTDNFFAVF